MATMLASRVLVSISASGTFFNTLNPELPTLGQAKAGRAKLL